MYLCQNQSTGNSAKQCTELNRARERERRVGVGGLEGGGCKIIALKFVNEISLHVSRHIKAV